MTSTRSEPTVRQLRVFLILAEELHFGRAAARLFMSQPALSQQIRALERNLGLQLVQRSSRMVDLTDEGRALLPDARAVVDTMIQLQCRANVHAREVSGHLVIGAIGAEAAMPYTRDILEGLRTQYPNVTVEMRSLNFLDQVTMMTRGEVDVAFLRPPLPRGCQMQQLATEPRVVCLAADDPLAAHDELALDQLANRTMADVPSETLRSWWDFWTVNPRPDGRRVRFGPVVPDIEALLLAVARGEAIAFLPAAARTFYPRPGVRYVDVTDLSPSTATLAWLARNRDRPGVAAIRHVARQVASGNSAASGRPGQGDSLGQ